MVGELILNFVIKKNVSTNYFLYTTLPKYLLIKISIHKTTDKTMYLLVGFGVDSSIENSKVDGGFDDGWHEM